MRITDTSDLWWKTAVVYCLDVETFLDWNDDGIGDLAGLAQRIDHLAKLGVTCLWLMPFYPTPDRDDGYDITDFYGVDSRLGTHGDLVEVIRMARDRGIRVIADLVVNHTSDRHPWFRAARRSRASRYRDFYVWSDDPPQQKTPNVFPDQEEGVWTFDEQAGQYYLHRFYKHQPDLNVANPAVRDEIAKIMGFWLAVGLSGFRVDAVPFLLETLGIDGAEAALSDPHDYLRALRQFMGRRSGDAMLLGEVNLPYEDQLTFFGADGDELTMQFDFITMQQLYLSLAREDVAPLAEALSARPDTPHDCQWGTFLRNHDELTLDKLSDDERQEVFAAFGPSPDMQVFGRGLRRRLPSMLDGDPRRIRMAYSLMFSLPGTPVLFYGEEIGMGENLAVEGRLAVRTPMQWTADAKGGFSMAAPSRFPAPLADGSFAPQYVNVGDQRNDPDSMLSFIQLLIQRYRDCPELGWGTFAVLDQPIGSVLAHECRWEEARLIAVHNVGSGPQTVKLELADADECATLHDLLEQGVTPVGVDGSAELTVDGYGYRWLRLVQPGDRRIL
jgi:trehalose synthase